MRPKPLIAKLAIEELKVEELNRYAEKLQGPTRVFSKRMFPFSVLLSGAKFLQVSIRVVQDKKSEILRAGLNDTEHALKQGKPIKR